MSNEFSQSGDYATTESLTADTFFTTVQLGPEPNPMSPFGALGFQPSEVNYATLLSSSRPSPTNPLRGDVTSSPLAGGSRATQTTTTYSDCGHTSTSQESASQMVTTATPNPAADPEDEQSAYLYATQGIATAESHLSDVKFEFDYESQTDGMVVEYGEESRPSARAASVSRPLLPLPSNRAERRFPSPSRRESRSQLPVPTTARRCTSSARRRSPIGITNRARTSRSHRMPNRKSTCWRMGAKSLSPSRPRSTAGRPTLNPGPPVRSGQVRRLRVDRGIDRNQFPFARLADLRAPRLHGGLCRPGGRRSHPAAERPCLCERRAARCLHGGRTDGQHDVRNADSRLLRGSRFGQRPLEHAQADYRTDVTISTSLAELSALWAYEDEEGELGDWHHYSAISSGQSGNGDMRFQTANSSVREDPAETDPAYTTHANRTYSAVNVWSHSDDVIEDDGQLSRTVIDSRTVAHAEETDFQSSGGPDLEVNNHLFNGSGHGSVLATTVYSGGYLAALAHRPAFGRRSRLDHPDGLKVGRSRIEL